MTPSDVSQTNVCGQSIGLTSQAPPLGERTSAAGPRSRRARAAVLLRCGQVVTRKTRRNPVKHGLLRYRWYAPGSILLVGWRFLSCLTPGSLPMTLRPTLVSRRTRSMRGSPRRACPPTGSVGYGGSRRARSTSGCETAVGRCRARTPVPRTAREVSVAGDSLINLPRAERRAQ
jgi:hypothetical protein